MIKTGIEHSTESLLIITGSMGAGKTSVLAEASDILTLRHIVHAAIDLDALGLAYLPSAAGTDDVMYRNLQSVCENYATLGVPRLLLARAVEDRAELELCRKAVSAQNTAICRLTASLGEMQQRVTKRDTGVLQRQFVDRVAILDAILDHAQLEDFVIINENRSVNDVVQEMLIKAGWISP
jgi:predicted ATP-binding protein involved in virulence